MNENINKCFLPVNLAEKNNYKIVNIMPYYITINIKSNIQE